MSDVERKYQDLRDICQHLLDMERTRDQPLPPGVSYFDAALDELQHFLVFGHSPALEARRRKNAATSDLPGVG